MGARRRCNSGTARLYPDDAHRSPEFPLGQAGPGTHTHKLSASVRKGSMPFARGAAPRHIISGDLGSIASSRNCLRRTVQLS